MYQVQDWSEVRRLDREGLSKRAIARRLRVESHHGDRLLALAGPPAYEREPAASSASIPSRAPAPEDAARGRERAGDGDPRAPAASGVRRRHHDPQGRTWRACARSSRPRPTSGAPPYPPGDPKPCLAVLSG